MWLLGGLQFDFHEEGQALQLVDLAMFQCCPFMQLSGTLLGESQVKAIVDEIKNVITASATRKQERSERAKAEDFDAEEGELLQEENEQEEEVFDQVCFKGLTWKQAFPISF